MRSNPEWIGKNDDSRPPPRVRLRIFQRCNGVCYLSKRRIMPGEAWHLEHKTALCNGGENRESNMAPALVIPHREKTKVDRRIKAKNDRVRKKHIMGRQSNNPLPCGRQSRWKKKITGEVIPR